MGNPDANVLELTTDSSYEHIDAFAALIAQAARQIGASEDDEVDLMIAVMEAVNNAIVHGNSEDTNKKIHMKIEVTPGTLTVWIRDEGPGFEPKNVPDPLAPQNVLHASGRGLLMMKAFMDEVDIRPAMTGTLVKMTKRFTSEKS